MMQIQLAQCSDLLRIKEMYIQVTAAMMRSGLAVWDEVYPAEFVAEDIAQKRLYVLTEDTHLLAGFVLCRTHAHAVAVTWQHDDKRACYMDRLAVSVPCARKGIGTIALRYALSLAKMQGAQVLRLFVADTNLPAIAFYKKNGFSQCLGSYEEKIDDTLTLRFYGFEISVLES